LRVTNRTSGPEFGKFSPPGRLDASPLRGGEPHNRMPAIRRAWAAADRPRAAPKPGSRCRFDSRWRKEGIIPHQYTLRARKPSRPPRPCGGTHFLSPGFRGIPSSVKPRWLLTALLLRRCESYYLNARASGYVHSLDDLLVFAGLSGLYEQ